MSDYSNNPPIVTNVTRLLNTGFDAFSNLFDLKIKPTGKGLVKLAKAHLKDDSNLDALRFRFKGNFTIPTATVQTYGHTYKGVEVQKIKPVVAVTRKLTLEFLIDSAYNLYKFFKAWAATVVHPTTGYFSGGVPFDYFATIELHAYAGTLPGAIINEQGKVKLPADATEIYGGQSIDSEIKWVFYQAYVFNLTEPTYDYKSANELTVKVDLAYGESLDPITTIV